MTLLSSILLFISLHSPEKVILTYSGNDSTIIMATVRKSCNDSMRVGLTDFCEFIDLIEIVKPKK